MPTNVRCLTGTGREVSVSDRPDRSEFNRFKSLGHGQKQVGTLPARDSTNGQDAVVLLREQILSRCGRGRKTVGVHRTFLCDEIRRCPPRYLDAPVPGGVDRVREENRTTECVVRYPGPDRGRGLAVLLEQRRRSPGTDANVGSDGPGQDAGRMPPGLRDLSDLVQVPSAQVPSDHLFCDACPSEPSLLGGFVPLDRYPVCVGQPLRYWAVAHDEQFEPCSRLPRSVA